MNGAWISSATSPVADRKAPGCPSKSNEDVMKKALFLILAVVLPAAALFPQGAPQNFSIDRAAQYYLGTSDELLIPVNIWGFVQKPGQYMVPDNTDLVALLSFAGGPNENARLNEIRIIRNDPKRGNLVYKIDVKKFV